MKKLILTLIAALGIVTGAHAAEGGIPWDKAPNRTTTWPRCKTVPSCSSTTA